MKFLTLSLLFLIPKEHLELKEVRIYAETYFYSIEEQIYMFEDGVEVYGENFSIKGGVALYDAVSRELYVVKSIEGKFNGETIKGNYLYLNLNTGKGEILNAEVNLKRGIYLIKAKRVKREGTDHYKLICSSFTPCRCPEGPPAWKVEGEEMELKEDRFSIKRGFFLLKDVPILYIPYLTVPVLKKRKTGFLFPEFVYSVRDGYEFFVPFFIAMDVDKDVTLEARAFTARGVGGKSTFRYALPGEKYLHLEGEFFWEGMLDGDWVYLFNGWGRFPFRYFNISFEGAYPSYRSYFKEYAKYVDKAYSGHIDSTFFVSARSTKWFGTVWGRYVENLKNSEKDLQVLPAVTVSLYPLFKTKWVRVEGHAVFRNYIEEGKGNSVQEGLLTPRIFLYPPISIFESQIYTGISLVMTNSNFDWNPEGGAYFSIPFGILQYLTFKPYFQIEGGKERISIAYFRRDPSRLNISTGFKLFFIKRGERIMRLRGWVESLEEENVNYELFFYFKDWISLKVEGRHADKKDYLLSALSLKDSRGDSFAVSWFSYREETSKRKSFNISTSIRLHPQLLFSSSVAMSVSPFALVQGVYRISYDSACRCWGVRFSYIDREGRENDRFSISIYLTGIGEFGTF